MADSANAGESSAKVPRLETPKHGIGKLRRGNPGHKGAGGRPTKAQQAAKAKAAEAQQLTVESHLARLEALSRKAEQSENYAAAITAEMKRGEVAGFYVKRHEDVGKLTPEERAARVEGLLKRRGLKLEKAG